MSVLAVLDADFATAPRLHQMWEFQASAEAEYRALLWQMRTGKSKLIVDTACHLAKARLLDTVIVLAPNGVHENWTEREVPTHRWSTVPCDYLTWRTSVAGTAAEAYVPKYAKREWQEVHEAFWNKARNMLKAGEDRLQWFAFASDTVTRKDVRNLIARIVRRRQSIMLVVDESDDYGAPGSKKTMMVRALAKKCAYRRILTGTVVENSPLRAFGQYELLKPGLLGFEQYEAFKERYAEYEMQKTRGGRRYPKLKEYRNLDELKERMARASSVVLRDDCHDMPDLVTVPRRVDLTDEQTRLYRELHRTRLLEIGDEQVSLGEVAPGLVKFQQIVSGYLVDEFGDLHEIPGGNPRLDAVVNEVLMTGGRNVVWCAFRYDMDRVKAALESAGRRVLEYHGRSSDEEKALARREFAPGVESDYDDLVGHPKSGGRGLNLSGADKIIWYSHTTDAVVRSQADERATQVGGQNVPVVDFRAPGVDDYILDDLLADKTERAEDVARTGLREVMERLALPDP